MIVLLGVPVSVFPHVFGAFFVCYLCFFPVCVAWCVCKCVSVCFFVCVLWFFMFVLFVVPVNVVM